MLLLALQLFLITLLLPRLLFPFLAIKRPFPCEAHALTQELCRILYVKDPSVAVDQDIVDTFINQDMTG